MQQTTEQVAQQAKIWYQSVNWQGVIDRLAEGLGTTGEYLWEVLVQGTFMDGVAGLIQKGLFLLVFGLMAIKSVKVLKSCDYTVNVWTEGQCCVFWMLGVIPMIAFVITTIVCMANVKEDLLKVGAPEYKAIEFVISQGK